MKIPWRTLGKGLLDLAKSVGISMLKKRAAKDSGKGATNAGKVKALLIAGLLLFVGCGIKVPPCILDGTCLPSPVPPSTPPASPMPTQPPVNECRTVDQCDCFRCFNVGDSTNVSVPAPCDWRYHACPAPEVSPTPPPPSPPVPSPPPTPVPPTPAPPSPTPPPASPAPCVETRTRPSLGPITPVWQGQTGPTFLPFTPPRFVKGGPGRKDVTHERYYQEHGNPNDTCETPLEKIEEGMFTGARNWSAPANKGFPVTVRPHDYSVSQNYIVTNAAAGRCVDRDLNKVHCLTGEIQERAGLWTSEGNVCPVAAPEVVTTTCPPTPGPPSSPTPPPTPPSGAPPIDETGNYPRPANGTCPPWFRDSLARVGISLLNRRPCFISGGSGTCEVLNFSATPKSLKPYCGHSCWSEAGVFNPAFCRVECEQWQPGGAPGSCQYPATGLVDSPPGMFIAHPDWGNRWEACDKRSAPEGSPGCRPDADCRQAFLCHDRAENRTGVTKAMACPQGVSPPATSDGPVPPGCSVTQVQH